jgi:hypothetical protein
VLNARQEIVHVATASFRAVGLHYLASHIMTRQEGRSLSAVLLSYENAHLVLSRSLEHECPGRYPIALASLHLASILSTKLWDTTGGGMAHHIQLHQLSDSVAHGLTILCIILHRRKRVPSPILGHCTKGVQAAIFLASASRSCRSSPWCHFSHVAGYSSK